jgi:hypothetical protein
MNRAKYFQLSNSMMAANLLAIVVSLTITILYYYEQPFLAKSIIGELGSELGWFTDVLYFVLIVAVTVWYERPIRRALRSMYREEEPDPEVMLKARRRLTDLNRHFDTHGYPNLRHGIGVHTGTAVAANIGSPDRLSYLLVGDTVNLASRLQTLTRETETEMIISAATRGRLPDSELNRADLKKLPVTHVKGKTRSVEIFAVA